MRVLVPRHTFWFLMLKLKTTEFGFWSHASCLSFNFFVLLFLTWKNIYIWPSWGKILLLFMQPFLPRAGKENQYSFQVKLL